jgi:hypothetical protein
MLEPLDLIRFCLGERSPGMLDAQPQSMRGVHGKLRPKSFCRGTFRFGMLFQHLDEVCSFPFSQYTVSTVAELREPTELTLRCWFTGPGHIPAAAVALRRSSFTLNPSHHPGKQGEERAGKQFQILGSLRPAEGT